MFTAVAIADVVIPKNYPATDPARVESLAKSIGEIGLLQPIVIAEGTKNLIAGRHRLEATAKLGGTIIEAKVLSCSALKAELAGIDENLERKILPKIVEQQQLKRRKIIWEELYPETKQGATLKKGPKRQNVATGKQGTFAENTAKATGKSPRSVQRDVAAAQKIPADVAETLQDHPVGKSRKQISELAALPVDQQRVVANALASGEVKTVAEAIAPVCPNCGGREFDEDGDCTACHEPEIAEKGPDRKTIKAAVTALGVLVRRLDDLKVDWQGLTLQGVKDTLGAM